MLLTFQCCGIQVVAHVLPHSRLPASLCPLLCCKSSFQALFWSGMLLRHVWVKLRTLLRWCVAQIPYPEQMLWKQPCQRTDNTIQRSTLLTGMQIAAKDKERSSVGVITGLRCDAWLVVGTAWSLKVTVFARSRQKCYELGPYPALLSPPWWISLLELIINSKIEFLVPGRLLQPATATAVSTLQQKGLLYGLEAVAEAWVKHSVTINLSLGL